MALIWEVLWKYVDDTTASEIVTKRTKKVAPSAQRTYIRSVLMYAVLVFYQALPLYLKYEIEQVQKRALSIIYPGILYSDA